MNRKGYMVYKNNCLYSVIEAEEFAKAYNKATEKTKKATKYLRGMAPVFKDINEFSNPLIMKVYFKNKIFYFHIVRKITKMAEIRSHKYQSS